MKEEEEIKEKSKRKMNKINVNSHTGKLPVGSFTYGLSWALSKTLFCCPTISKVPAKSQ